MEIDEGQDPEKKRLIETSDRHKRALEKEVKSISDKTERMLINGLVIGGSLALTYLIVSQWGKSKRKKKAKAKANESSVQEDVEAAGMASEPQTPSMISQIGTKVINQATLILLDIAKDKLMEYLESRKQRDENS